MAKKHLSTHAHQLVLVTEITAQSTLGYAQHTLIHIEDPHYKFYQIHRTGDKVDICYGKIGTSGNHSIKQLNSTLEAKSYVAKVIQEKLNKGYVEPKSEEVTVVKPVKRKTKELTREGLDKLDAFLSTLK